MGRSVVAIDNDFVFSLSFTLVSNGVFFCDNVLA